jgi:hypothetical protein
MVLMQVATTSGWPYWQFRVVAEAMNGERIASARESSTVSRFVERIIDVGSPPPDAAWTIDR